MSYSDSFDSSASRSPSRSSSSSRYSSRSRSSSYSPSHSRSSSSMSEPAGPSDIKTPPPFSQPVPPPPSSIPPPPNIEAPSSDSDCEEQERRAQAQKGRLLSPIAHHAPPSPTGSRHASPKSRADSEEFGNSRGSVFGNNSRAAAHFGNTPTNGGDGRYAQTPKNMKGRIASLKMFESYEQCTYQPLSKDMTILFQLGTAMGFVMESIAEFKPKEDSGIKSNASFSGNNQSAAFASSSSRPTSGGDNARHNGPPEFADQLSFDNAARLMDLWRPMFLKMDELATKSAPTESRGASLSASLSYTQGAETSGGRGSRATTNPASPMNMSTSESPQQQAVQIGHDAAYAQYLCTVLSFIHKLFSDDAAHSFLNQPEEVQTELVDAAVTAVEFGKNGHAGAGFIRDATSCFDGLFTFATMDTLMEVFLERWLCGATGSVELLQMCTALFRHYDGDHFGHWAAHALLYGASRVTFSCFARFFTAANELEQQPPQIPAHSAEDKSSSDKQDNSDHSSPVAITSPTFAPVDAKALETHAALLKAKEAFRTALTTASSSDILSLLFTIVLPDTRLSSISLTLLRAHNQDTVLSLYHLSHTATSPSCASEKFLHAFLTLEDGDVQSMKNLLAAASTVFSECGLETDAATHVIRLLALTLICGSKKFHTTINSFLTEATTVLRLKKEQAEAEEQARRNLILLEHQRAQQAQLQSAASVGSPLAQASSKAGDEDVQTPDKNTAAAAATSGSVTFNTAALRRPASAALLDMQHQQVQQQLVALAIAFGTLTTFSQGALPVGGARALANSRAAAAAAAAASVNSASSPTSGKSNTKTNLLTKRLDPANMLTLHNASKLLSSLHAALGVSPKILPWSAAPSVMQQSVLAVEHQWAKRGTEASDLMSPTAAAARNRHRENLFVVSKDGMAASVVNKNDKQLVSPEEEEADRERRGGSRHSQRMKTALEEREPARLRRVAEEQTKHDEHKAGFRERRRHAEFLRLKFEREQVKRTFAETQKKRQEEKHNRVHSLDLSEKQRALLVSQRKAYQQRQKKLEAEYEQRQKRRTTMMHGSDDKVPDGFDSFVYRLRGALPSIQPQKARSKSPRQRRVALKEQERRKFQNKNIGSKKGPEIFLNSCSPTAEEYTPKTIERSEEYHRKMILDEYRSHVAEVARKDVMGKKKAEAAAKERERKKMMLKRGSSFAGPVKHRKQQKAADEPLAIEDQHHDDKKKTESPSKRNSPTQDEDNKYAPYEQPVKNNKRRTTTKSSQDGGSNRNSPVDTAERKTAPPSSSVAKDSASSSTASSRRSSVASSRSRTPSSTSSSRSVSRSPSSSRSSSPNSCRSSSPPAEQASPPKAASPVKKNNKTTSSVATASKNDSTKKAPTPKKVDYTKQHREERAAMEANEAGARSALENDQEAPEREHIRAAAENNRRDVETLLQAQEVKKKRELMESSAVKIQAVERGRQGRKVATLKREEHIAAEKAKKEAAAKKAEEAEREQQEREAEAAAAKAKAAAEEEERLKKEREEAAAKAAAEEKERKDKERQEKEHQRQRDQLDDEERTARSDVVEMEQLDRTVIDEAAGKSHNEAVGKANERIAAEEKEAADKRTEKENVAATRIQAAARGRQGRVKADGVRREKAAAEAAKRRLSESEKERKRSMVAEARAAAQEKRKSLQSTPKNSDASTVDDDLKYSDSDFETSSSDDDGVAASKPPASAAPSTSSSLESTTRTKPQTVQQQQRAPVPTTMTPPQEDLSSSSSDDSSSDDDDDHKASSSSSEDDDVPAVKPAPKRISPTTHPVAAVGSMMRPKRPSVAPRSSSSSSSSNSSESSDDDSSDDDVPTFKKPASNTTTAPPPKRPMRPPSDSDSESSADDSSDSASSDTDSSDDDSSTSSSDEE